MTEIADLLRADAAAREAGKLLGAAGFVEIPLMRKDARVAHRACGNYYDLVMQFHDGHMEAIRQEAPAENPAEQTQLWFPGQAEEPAKTLWTKSGDPLEVTQELLLLPTS